MLFLHHPSSYPFTTQSHCSRYRRLFLSYFPNSSHLLSSSFVMPTCSGLHHGLSTSNLASVAYQLAMKPNRIQYSLAVASLLYQPSMTTLPICAPSAFPLQRVSRHHNRPLQHSTARSTPSQPIMCLDVFLSFLPLAPPVYSVQRHHFIALTHIPIFRLLSLLLSSLSYTARACAESQVPKQKFSSFPQVKPKAYTNIYIVFTS